MAFVTVDDVLCTAEGFEERLVKYYKALCDSSTREGVRLLADYMGRHRRRLSAALERLDPDERERISACPIRYEPEAPDVSCFKNRELTPDATAHEVLDVAIEIDECLAELYRQVLRQDLDQEVKDLFESLVRSEERDEVVLKKIKATDYF